MRITRGRVLIGLLDRFFRFTANA